jgi:lysozyme
MTDPRAPIFAAVRAAARPGLFNDPGNVLALDNLLDAFDVPRAQTGMSTGPAGIALMKEFEGYARVLPGGRVQAYPDPGTGGEPWTIGFGSTGADPFNGGRINRNTIWTDAQAETRFRQHLAEFERAVNAAIKVPTTQNQFDALMSLTYNIGAAAMARSTLISHHNARRFADAANEFARWNRAGGSVMPGLTRRRAAEAALYRRP